MNEALDNTKPRRGINFTEAFKDRFKRFCNARGWKMAETAEDALKQFMKQTKKKEKADKSTETQEPDNKKTSY